MDVQDLPQRIASKIKIDTDTGCWNWTAAKCPLGYGRVGFGKSLKYSHRVVYEILVGPIPTGLVTDHLCRNSSCCNPDHLEPVTQEENVRRGNVGINHRVKTHCPQGHPYSGENLYVKPGGGRSCRTCQKDHAAAHYQRRISSEGAV